jgi:hypothetical protein
MPWYAASVVLYFKFKDGNQNTYPVWENVILIEANTPQEAFEKAKRIGLTEEGDSDGTMKWENRPASIVFAGVRKVIECTDKNDRPMDSTEITYSQFRLRDKQSLDKLIKGDPVEVTYEE